ncbi:MAG: acpS [Solirubrobacteraceae bacterium]|nr:acpS [Solirubrobacteraceae bacterium]
MDLASVTQVAEMLSRHPQRYLARVYTPAEVQQCGERSAVLAERFAAKEAVRKLLGAPDAVPWTAIEILAEPTGGLDVRLTGSAARTAADSGIVKIDVSVSRVGGYASAVALGKDAT